MPLDINELKRACEDSLPADGHKALLNSIQRQFPGHEVEFAHTRPEWYRVGGVVDGEGKKIAEHLREWAEDNGVDDILSFYEEFGAEPYFVTRVIGRTHLFIIKTGEDALDFIQIAVEEFEEVMDRPLFDEDNMPEDVEDLVDPIEYTKIEPVQVNLPRYSFKNMRVLKDIAETLDEANPFKRFYQEWKNSSAAQKGHFTDHWVLYFNSYLNPFGEHTLEIRPKSRGETLEFPMDLENLSKGEDLAKAIHSFDRDAGYPMAWYFYMLTSQKEFHKLAEAVYDDMSNEFAYLPAKDLKILKKWVGDPYCF